MLVIAVQEFSQLLHGALQHGHFRQIHDTEVIGVGPVEAAAVDEKHMFFPEKIQHKLLIVGDAEPFHVQLREHVKGCIRVRNADTGDIV